MLDEIKTWLEDPNKDYYRGVRLLETYGNNANLARNYKLRSPKYNMSGLIYDVSKLIPIKVEATTPKVVELREPEVITIIKKKAHDTFVKLSKLTNDIYELGETNEPDVVEKRKKLLNIKSQFAFKYDSLMIAIKEYKSTAVVPKNIMDLIEEPQIKKEKPQQTENPYSQMPTLQLNKLYKSTRQLINRHKNQLEYQQDTKGDKPNPLPDCPKKDKHLKIINEKSAELQLISEELEKRK